jgi:hypothetical protein
MTGDAISHGCYLFLFLISLMLQRNIASDIAVNYDSR